MRGRDPIVVGALSLLVPTLDALTAEPAFDRASRTALVLLVWLVLALVPGPAAPTRRTTLGYLAPSVGLALGLDLAGGHPPLELVRATAISLLLFLTWSEARVHSTRGLRAARRYALAWLVLVPGIAGLHVALHWASGTPAGPWVLVDPLVFTHRWGAAAAADPGVPWAALTVAGLVVGAVASAREGAERS
jgi:hypothetical protein